MTSVKTPSVFWAQRSSATAKEMNLIYLTVKLGGIVHSSLVYTVTDKGISLKVNANQGDKEREYAFDLDFHSQVVPGTVKKSVTPQSVTLVILKKDITARGWPRLSKTALPYVKTDFSRWTGEDDESDNMAEDGSRDTTNMGTKSSLSGTKSWGLLKQPNQVSSSSITTVTTPQALLAQQSSSTETMTNIISLGAKTQDTSESTFKKAEDLNSRGLFFLDRFKRLGELRDIEKAISILADAVQLTPDGDSEKPGRLSNLGSSLLRRFEHRGEMEDIEKGILIFEDAMRLAADDSKYTFGDPAGISSNLGNMYLCRFEHTGNIQDIHRAISHHQSAVESTPSGRADLPTWLNNLGSSYLRQFQCTGNLQDVHHAISHLQSAVESTPSSHADHPRWLNNLGTSYLCRFEHTGNPQDIDHAITHHQKAIESTFLNQTDLPGLFNSLGTSYVRRSKHTGSLQDIDHAISHYQSAIKSTPSGSHALFPGLFNNLGTAYLCRFEYTSDLLDVNHAISYHQSAVESTPSSHAQISKRFHNLGNSYLRRFGCTSDLQDIDHAISYHQKAVENTLSSQADLPGLLNSLGSSYLYRFVSTGNLQDINHSISHHQNALKSTPPDHVLLPVLFNNLGNSYSHHFKCTRNLQDIDYAISHHQNAVDSTPSGHADLPAWLNNLGNSYLYRFKHNNDIQDHEEFRHLFTAKQSNFPNWFKNGEILSTQDMDICDVQKAIASYRQAAQANGVPSVRMAAARQTVRYSSVFDEPQCLADFSLAVTLLTEVAGIEQTIHRRHANLGDSYDLVKFAVATALRFEKPDLALEWLEQGRCLVWNQLNQLRTPIDDLHTRSVPLADRFTEVASSLEFYGTRSSSSKLTSHATIADEIRFHNQTRNHTLLAAEYKQLLEEIRALPDFHNFLKPPNATNLLSSLPPGSVVVIFNIYETRCDALALIAGIEEVLPIPLEKFGLNEAEQLQRRLQCVLLEQREAEDGDRATFRLPLNAPLSISVILGELWCKVVQPILTALGYSLESRPNSSDRHRIWWCPTGPLSFLPLHAAGIYGSAYEAGQCVSDFVVSSYTPTVGSLNEKFGASTTTSKCTDLILISQPNTPGLSSIPWTQKEVHNLKELMDQSVVNMLLLEDAEATIEKVRTEMRSCNWVHFACHGIQDMNEPLKSGVHLHDGRLELLEIMRQKISNADLAFLSACQTSKGDPKLSEEVVHLSAGMLAAGYRGVVGTMWSISDMHGPEFATEFYQYLFRENGSEGLDSSQAAYALDHATRKVRESLEEDDTALLTWVPYIHFGY